MISEEMLKKAAAEEVGTIVLGLPKHMNGTEGERAEKTKEFQEMLARRSGLPVVLWDERLTTVAADEILEESGVARKDRKKVIDRVAAGIILQSYLDWQKRQEAAQNGGTNEGR